MITEEYYLKRKLKNTKDKNYDQRKNIEALKANRGPVSKIHG